MVERLEVLNYHSVYGVSGSIGACQALGTGSNPVGRSK